MKLNEIRQKIKDKSSREARISGNPYSDSDIDRELANAGKVRQAEDIPKQDVTKRSGKIEAGNVHGVFQSTTIETGGIYKIGSAQRPPIHHDAGFSNFSKIDPELSDYRELYKWTAMMEGAALLRSDLADAVASYSHFLNGEGKSRIFSYDRYVNNDASGRITLRNAILDAQDAAIQLWSTNGQPKRFNFTGPVIPCGANNKKLTNVRKMFPYPATENWQKTIGAHAIWISGSVTVVTKAGSKSKPEFKMNFVLHAEDQYNFNPGMKDIASGLPDDSNGRLVVVGFAHGYRHNAVLKRSFSWKGFDLGVASMGIRFQMRQRKPDMKRRG